MRIPERRWQRALIFGFVYFCLGVGSALISNDLESELVKASIRIGIFLLAGAVFFLHLHFELGVFKGKVGRSSVCASGAVAFGSLLLAAYAVGSAWFNTSPFPESLLAALAIWPLATGFAAFSAALVLGSLTTWARRIRTRREDR